MICKERPPGDRCSTIKSVTNALSAGRITRGIPQRALASTLPANKERLLREAAAQLQGDLSSAFRMDRKSACPPGKLWQRSFLFKTCVPLARYSYAKFTASRFPWGLPRGTFHSGALGWWELGLTWKKRHISCQWNSLCSDGDEQERRRFVMQAWATVSSKSDISWPRAF